mmetsp:Transcript_10439/g.20717  ORF Transcript_10439/g.20717 Transcript_10439/m.20717 type:complete len:222 (-) Transcript_10439:1620-2285(-)
MQRFPAHTCMHGHNDCIVVNVFILSSSMVLNLFPDHPLYVFSNLSTFRFARSETNQRHMSSGELLLQTFVWRFLTLFPLKFDSFSRQAELATHGSIALATRGLDLSSQGYKALDNFRIGQGRSVSQVGVFARNLSQQPAHDFATTGLWEGIGTQDVIWTCESSDVGPDSLLQSINELSIRFETIRQCHVRKKCLSLDGIFDADHSTLGHRLVCDQGRLHLS